MEKCSTCNKTKQHKKCEYFKLVFNCSQATKDEKYNHFIIYNYKNLQILV